MGEALSKTAFAKRVGVAPSTLSKWIDAGLPVLENGRIDAAAADGWLKDNLDHSRRDNWQSGSSPDGPTLSEARRARENLKVQRERMELARDARLLIEKSAVQRFLEARGRLDRDSHLAWCSRMAAVLAGEFGIDSAQLYARLDEEMRLHLRELAQTPVGEAMEMS